MRISGVSVNSFGRELNWCYVQLTLERDGLMAVISCGSPSAKLGWWLGQIELRQTLDNLWVLSHAYLVLSAQVLEYYGLLTSKSLGTYMHLILPFEPTTRSLVQ
jgi:hypothetical protein